jgi:hypothetical protein
MKSLIEISISKIDFQDTLNYYLEEGFEYLSSIDNGESITVVLRGEIQSVAQYSNEHNKSYIEFDDKTRSPLYIKRERNFWED